MPLLESLKQYGSHIPLSRDATTEFDTAVGVQRRTANRLVDRDNPYVRAWLDTFPETEGADYNTLVGGKKFTGYDKYPGRASDAYQITGDTYKDIAPKLGKTDFSPLTQDLIAIQNLADKGTLEQILRGASSGDTLVRVPGTHYLSIRPRGTLRA